MSVVTATPSTQIQTQSWGAQKVAFGTMAFDNSGYDASGGGDAITPSEFGLSQIDQMLIQSTGGYDFDYIESSGKVKVYLSAGGSGTSGATSGGTPSGTNAASAVTPGYHGTVDGITVGTPALTHNADPVSNLAANPLFVVEAYGVGNKNIGVLQSNCNGTTSILGSVDDVSGACGAATPRFWVTHNATPAGVQVYVNESDNDKLCCVSPTGEDVIVMMPFEAIANGVPGYAYAVTIHHDPAAATYKPLYFDDNGAADAQLAFVDTGAAGGVIYAADIEVVGPQYTGITGNCGSAAAQVFSGSALVTHTHTLAGGTAGEVGNGTDISALTAVSYVAIGR